MKMFRSLVVPSLRRRVCGGHVHVLRHRMPLNLSQQSSRRFYSAEETKPEEQASEEPVAEAEAVEADAPQDDELKKCKEEVAKKDEEMKDMKNRLYRMAADAENARKRAERDVETKSKHAITDFAKSLIAVSDNLSRALEMADQVIKTFDQAEKTPLAESYTSLREGIELTRSSLEDAYNHHGVKKVESLGEKFDPKVHHVLSTVADPSNESDTIIAVHMEGYVIHDRVLRAAKVVTVKNPPKPAADSSDS